MTTEYVPPRAATLHLGGDAWAHPDLEPLVRPLYAEGAGKPIIRRHPDNPRRGDHEAIVESVRVNGVYTPPKVQRSTGYVLAGNHSFDAMLDQGATSMPWVWLDVDDDEARRIMLADNRTAELGGYDQTLLLEQVRAAAAADQLLAGTGYSNDDLAELERAVKHAEDVARRHATDPDDAPPVPETAPISNPGDIWELGEHRLAVGDSTDPGTWTRLLADSQVDAVWTDPPYGVDYKGKTADKLKIKGDKKGNHDYTADLLRSSFKAVLTNCKPGAPWFVAAPAGPARMPFSLVLTELKLWRQTLVWLKDAFVLGRSEYHYRHEDIYFGYAPSDRYLGRWNNTTSGLGWYGGHARDSVISVPRPRRNDLHPTMKPVELVVVLLEDVTQPGEIVADPFGGSGTTLIACQQIGRSARLVELDPRYADVICRRYQEHTGTIPLRNGTPHDFTNG